MNIINGTKGRWRLSEYNVILGQWCHRHVININLSELSHTRKKTLVRATDHQEDSETM